MAMRPLILEYFEKDGEDLGLSSTDIKLTEAWYITIDAGLLIVATLELIRYLASLKFHELSTKIDNEEALPLLAGR